MVMTCIVIYSHMIGIIITWYTCDDETFKVFRADTFVVAEDSSTLHELEIHSIL